MAGAGQDAGDGAQGWQQRPHQPPRSTSPGASRGLAISALVLGIVACALFWTVVGGFLLGLLAVVLGIVAALRGRSGPGSGRGMAVGGAVLGALAMIGAGLILVVGLALWNSDSVEDFKQCLREARSDADRHSCELKFDREYDKDWRDLGT
ncbi:DUF4190 domain-containing protein [Streptomyces boluensis]|uniref:DUF4190 domain-containing protein n=1 Tax=Streptomyces boluensis TaxID=1775135 RepID=A0A964UQV4_9ACTN|nr:DUF4190 domain-containing protein [Streptomyces boluensis]NBE53591.1 DUF4190 domain-containing protein [Streptomyces boluensis]